jgi:hypothetical protein
MKKEAPLKAQGDSKISDEKEAPHFTNKKCTIKAKGLS